MFKAARWRSEKNKTKAVFRFQFHATQITKLGWEVAMVSLVPLDVGKPTAKSEKAVVLDGTCHWKKPIYETVKLMHDSETGKINDKLYHFVVSATGSVIGEATINLSDYAAVLKPSTVVLLLRESDSGPTLHVEIQRVQADAGKREADEVQEQRKITDELNGRDKFTTNVHHTEGCTFTKSQMVFPYCSTMPLQDKSNGNLKMSDSSGTVSVSSTNENSGQCTLKENGTKNDNMQKDYVSFPSPFHKIGPHGSVDGSTNSSEETKLDERLQHSDISVVSDHSLERAREIRELEMLTLRKQVVKETRHGQELSRELRIIKEDRDALRRDFEELKRRCGDGSASKKSHFHSEIPQSTLEEVIQELNHEKSLNANLRLQLQKTQESNSELLLAVQDLDELLEQKNREFAYINSPTIPVKLGEDPSKVKIGNEYFNLQSYDCKRELIETMYNEDDEQHALEALVKGHDDVRVAYSLEQQIMDLNNEIDMCKRDREDLEMQTEQIALDYEILKQENHNISRKLEQCQLREQLWMQYECSAHLSIIRDLEDHVENLKNEVEEKTEVFEGDCQSIMHAKIQQEQRAIQAEEALRKTRWSNAKTAEKLEEEFERLSAQISSTFHMNEKLTVEAITEASELRMQKGYLEELLEKRNEEFSSVHDQYQVKVQELSRIIDFMTKETDRLLMELKDTSENLETQKRDEVARGKAFSEEILMLKAGLEQLSRENSYIPEHIEKERKSAAEMEQLKESTKKLEQTLQNRSLEGEMLGRELASARREAGASLKELHHLRQLKDEKEKVIRNLNLKVTALRAQHSEMKQSLFDDEVEKENLRKEVFNLRCDLQKKDDTINGIEKRLKDNNRKNSQSNGITKTAVKNKNNMNGLAVQGCTEVATLREKIKLLEGKLKMKDKTLGETKSSFLVKEKDLCSRIEELERNIGKNTEDLHEGITKKDDLSNKHIGDISENECDVYQLQTPMIQVERLDTLNANGQILSEPTTGDKEGIYKLNGINRELPMSTSTTVLEIDEGDIVSNSHSQGSLVEMLSEVSELKEKNEVMEAELKEMQERYSDISLKFAEVEGERQQLVMTVRSLRSSLKN